MRYDFADIEALHFRARRERAEAVHRLIIAPVLALFAHITAPKRIGHAARPHLARQGQSPVLRMRGCSSPTS